MGQVVHDLSLHPIAAGTYLTVYTLFWTTIAFHVENRAGTHVQSAMDYIATNVTMEY